jgi:carbon-monoxide dehydrogenase medium subunit
MKPAPFEYLRPESVEEALALLAERGEDAKPLAGGQSLVPLLRLRLAFVDALVDVARLDELDGIEGGPGGLRIGAATRQRAVELSTVVAGEQPVLVEALGLVGHDAIRSRGTFGGSLAHADAGAELPACVLALDGEIEARTSAASRRIEAAVFLQGHFTTALAENELLMATVLPSRRMPEGAAILEVTRRRGDFALAGAVARLGGRDGVCELARVVVFAVGPHAVRVGRAEQALVGSDLADADLAAAAAEASAAVEPRSDIHASAAYRRRAVGVLCRRALERARDRLRGSPT